MKKVLFASTILASLGSVAAAETGVSISGYGRFGLQYYSNGGVMGGLWDPEAGNYSSSYNNTSIHTRFRLNINAKTETDTGVTFGGRIRLQYQDTNSSGTSNTSPALMYATYEGFRLEVGNISGAIDSDPAGVYYGSEIGLIDASFGDSLLMNYYGLGAFASSGYNRGRMGIQASYSIDGFTGILSYIDYSQYYDLPGDVEETQLYLSYVTGEFTVAAGGAWNQAGIDGTDSFFIGGRYDTDAYYVGLTYTDEGEVDAPYTFDGVAKKDLSSTVTLYGGYVIDALTLKGYVAYNDSKATMYDGLGHKDKKEYAFGIGADYDLGGAKLTGSIQRDYWEETYADLGVRFDF